MRDKIGETVPEVRLPDHELRLEKAKAQASWEMGEPDWAQAIIDIYVGEDEPCADAIKAWQS